MPIRHLDGETSSVFAYGDELDNWLKSRGMESRDEPSEFRKPEPAPLQEPLQQIDSSQRTKPEGTERNGNIAFLSASGTERIRAADLLLLAGKMWESVSQSNLSAMAKLYQAIIDRDFENAEAFAGLSRTLISAGVLGNLRTNVAYHSAKAALKRALEIDSDLSMAKCAAAWLMMLCDRDWHGARRGMEELLSERPPVIEAIVGRALLYIAESCPAHASNLLLDVSQRFALNAGVLAFRGWSYYLEGSYSMALALVAEAKCQGHVGAVLDAVEALASIQVEEPARSIARMEELAESSPQHYTLRGALGYAYAMAGQTERAHAVLDVLARSEVRQTNNYAYPTALVLIGLGELQAAVQWLEQSYREGSLWSLAFPIDPILVPMRHHSAFQLFMSRVKYPAVKPTVCPVSIAEESDFAGLA